MKSSEVDAVIAAIALQQHGVFTGAQVRDAGVSAEALRHRLRTGRVQRLKHGIFRLRDHPFTWESELMSLLFDAGPDAVVSHRSAARLHGLWRYRNTPALEVTAYEIHDHKVTLGGLHRSAWLPPSHRVVVAGFPSTSLARTCFDLMGDPEPGLRRTDRGRRAHQQIMLRVVNNAMRRGGLTLGALVAVRAEVAKRGRPGSALSKRIVARLRTSYVPTDSEGEDTFLELVEAHELPEPKRQVRISGERGYIGTVDFLYEALKLVIEIDGSTHDGPLDREADAARDEELRAEGYEVWRIPYLDELVPYPDRVVAELKRRLNVGSFSGS
ncbi:MAG: type IV toxin-antitoxin system AbiEi family antitoxin domain-containing protein [Acidimicrobiales bacterium]